MIPLAHNQELRPRQQRSWKKMLAISVVAFILVSAANLSSSAQTTSAPSFSVSPSPAQAGVFVGGGEPTASVGINIVGTNGFKGCVSVAISGVPQGLTASLNWPTACVSSPVTLRIATSDAVVPGTYLVQLTATSGNQTATTILPLTVTQPTFNISPSANSFTIAAGGNAWSSPIALTVVNDIGLLWGPQEVGFSASGVPSGVTVTFARVSSTTTNMTFKASTSVVPGTYQILAVGGEGAAKASTPIVLTIPAPTFSLSPSITSVPLQVGGATASSTVTITGQNGFIGSVDLSVSGVPAGVTASWSQPTTTTKSALTFTPSATAVAGTYPVTISGKSGALASTTTVLLTITAPSFSLSSSLNTVPISVGGASASSMINIAGQNGFSNSVTLSASGVPSGIGASFSQSSTKSGSSLTFTPSATALAGNYPVTVTGKSGSLTATTSLVLAVTAPSFNLTSSLAALSLASGGPSSSSTISIVDQNGFNGSVTFSASGVPSGVTASFSQTSASGSSSLTFTPSSSVLAGSYPVTVTGKSGALSASTTIVLTIATPSFSLSSSSGAISVAAGGTGSSTISVSGQSGFGGNVSLSVSGLPAGVTAVLSSSLATVGAPVTLTFSPAATAAAGTYPVLVTGTAGTITSSANLQLTVTQAANAVTAISITQPGMGFNVIPGSVRRIFAQVTGGTTKSVKWSVTGGAMLSSSTGNWVDVTAPAAGTSCAINNTASNYSVSSATQFTLTAQSQETPSQTASITVNVCKPAVQVNVVPFYTTLYSGQEADIQAFVWGSVNRDVTWAITSQPNGGDGALADNSNQDTVFSATVAGRYTLAATSAADHTVTNTATVYVTGHAMPYQVTPSETMPVDCSVDPALTGTVYDVGPSQTYKTIASVPWPSLLAGSTVRIHNEDTTGGNPTTYHEYFQVKTHAARTQPVRVCGVPDSRGNLPVIDASNSTGRSDVSTYSAGYTAVGIGNTGWAGNFTNATWTGSEYLIVEGLKIQNAKPPYTFTTPSGTAGSAFGAGTACIRLFTSMDTVVRGVDAYNCGNGFFSDFNSNNGFAVVANTLYEGNHLHDNGVTGSYSQHQFYIQGWNEVVQFNLVDQYQSGAEGSNFKGRGFPEIVRYNHFGDGAARQLDMVDNQDAGAYSTFEGYLNGGTSSYLGIYPKDTYTADLLAAAVEAHHADYVYGNTFVNSSAGYPIHYSTDHGSEENDRIGTLWFFSNSFYEPTCNGCPNYRWYMFDTSGGGGDDFTEIEWPQIQALNNAIWMDSPKQPYFFWNKENNQFTTFGKNTVTANWGSGNMTGGDGTGWAPGGSKYAFQGASNSADTVGVSNLVTTSTDPFDITTFLANPVLVNAGTNMPSGAPKLPVRFQYSPSAVQALRTQPLTMGAMD